VGGFDLIVRGSALTAVELLYRVGSVVGSAGVFLVGGFVPALAGWLRDEVRDLATFLESLGGVRIAVATKDPDADLGPAIARADAPALFTEAAEIARRLGARPVEQIRLTYLPCCGVVAWRRSRALVLGLPLLHALNLAELRAVLAHELAHLARGDATRAARSARFVEGLVRALDDPPAGGHRPWGPLLAWARLCRAVAEPLHAPIARGQEARADRAAAQLAGGDAAASALVKVALVQPLFREALEAYDPADPDLPNLYAFFRAFWTRLPETLQTAMRHALLSGSTWPTLPEGVHPPLLDRIAWVQSYAGRTTTASDLAPASTLLGDLEALEQMLHNRLFAVSRVEPSVFRRARF
jgi:Zn-dependent protease with chaperone function